VLIAVVGCTEDLTTPGACPQTCPGGTIEIRDTTIVATLGGDSSFVGYVAAGDGSGLLTSTAEPADQYLATMRFGVRPDSVVISDSTYNYTVDSVRISIGVLARDANATGIQLQVYRAPATVDSNVTYADLAAAMTPANFLDSIAVPDTMESGNLTVVFSGADLAKVEIPPADSGVLAIAMGITASSPTGIELGNNNAGGFVPTVTYYISVPEVDSASQPSAIVRVPSFATFVEQNPPPADPDQLQVGGAPSARFIVRFSVPDSVLIGVQILRAELLLTPVAPIAGVPNIGTTVTARGVLSDQGAKSPLVPILAPLTAVTVGSADTVSIEVIDLVRAWQVTTNPPAHAFFVSLQPEAASFTLPVFGSTRSATGAPRLRITYVPPIPSQEP
jgi:hypothetical protein